MKKIEHVMRRIPEESFLKNPSGLFKELEKDSSEVIIEGKDGEEIVMMSLKKYQDSYEDYVMEGEILTYEDLIK